MTATTKEPTVPTTDEPAKPGQPEPLRRACAELGYPVELANMLAALDREAFTETYRVDPDVRRVVDHAHPWTDQPPATPATA